MSDRAAPRRLHRWELFALFVAVNIAWILVVAGTSSSLSLQRTALTPAVRQQCTSFLAEKLLVGSGYSVRLSGGGFSDQNTVAYRYTLRSMRSGTPARLGRLQIGRVRCHLRETDGAMRVSGIEVRS